MAKSVMQRAWEMYRREHVGCDRFYRADFASCLRGAWASVKPRFVELDMRPAFERGHMYQGI